MAVKTVPCGGSSMGKGPEVGRSLAYSQNSKEAGVAGTERERDREKEGVFQTAAGEHQGPHHVESWQEWILF